MSSSIQVRPLRILHFICPTGFYGAEKWVLSLVGNIDDDAVISELAVIREQGDSTLKLADEFRDLGLVAHEVDASGRFDLSIVSRLTRLLRDRKIDVLHTHGYKPDLLGAIAARKTNVRTVCTTHGFPKTKDLKLRFYTWLGCQSFRFFDIVVSLTEQLRSDVRRYGVKQEHTQVIESGIDLRPLACFIRDRNPGHYHSEGSLTVGFIGQMIARKNIRALLEVFDRLTQTIPELELKLVGDGSERPELERYAASLPSHERIQFTGFVDEPLAHLQEFDLFVMTSAREGTPLCLMEAMAMGVPVAAFDIPGVDLLIQQNETGLLARHGDNEGLIKHCKALLGDAELSRRLAQAARSQILERFSAARMARDYVCLYRSVLELREAH